MSAAAELDSFTTKLEAAQKLQEEHQAVKARASELSAEVHRSRMEIGTRDKRIAALEKENERVAELKKEVKRLETELAAANRSLKQRDELIAANEAKVADASRFAELLKSLSSE